MNKAKPGVTINLDKERTLHFNLNALAAFEDATGVNVFQGGFGVDGLSARDMRAMLWACLVTEDEALTIAQVGAMIDTDNMAAVSSRLAAVFEVSMPEAAEAPLPNRATRRKGSTG